MKTITGNFNHIDLYHDSLTYNHNRANRRLTNVPGHVLKPILA